MSKIFLKRNPRFEMDFIVFGFYDEQVKILNDYKDQLIVYFNDKNDRDKKKQQNYLTETKILKEIKQVENEIKNLQYYIHP